MKKQKAIESVWLAKTLSVVLAVLVVVAMYMLPASAAELTADGSGASTVAHTVSAEFTAGIPAYVMPDEIGEKTAKYTVTLESAVIPDSHELTAKVEYSGSMTEQNGVELPYELFDETGNAIVSGAKVLSKAAGMPDDSVSVSFGAALTAKVRYAGVYTDTATFTFDVAEKVYTLDEINADEHLYAIGLTKLEYVVAQFNEDFSAVTIFKNGENSDGLMMSWDASQNKSPFSGRNELLTVSILNGVSNIGDYAFFDCGAFATANLPESITVIGAYAFNHCASLNDFDIPQNVTYIGSYAFSGCSSFINVKLPQNITEIQSGTFNGCKSLETVIIPDGVTFIGAYAFNYCSALKSVTIPNGVTTITQHSFSNCTELRSITIPDSVTVFDNYAFKNCELLESIYIPKGATRIGSEAFYNCRTLESVTIPDRVKKIATDSFGGCENLTTIYGASGSYAETFAAQNGYTFIAQ